MKGLTRNVFSTQNNCRSEGSNINSTNTNVDSCNNISEKRDRKRQRRDQSHAPSLLSWKQVPEELREPGILTGYRLSYQPWTYYLKSLFWIHNETVNIWTHLLSPMSLLMMIFNFSQDVGFFTDQASHALLVYTVGTSLFLFLSASAHLFTSRSPTADFVFFSLDYMGLGIVVYVQGVMLYYTSGNELFYRTVGPTFLQLLTICGVFGMTGMMLARTILTTKSLAGQLLIAGSFGVTFVAGHLPILFSFYNCTNDNSCEKEYILHAACIYAITILQGIVYASHLPEKAFPGKFDIWGHSHQLFHIGASVNIHLGAYIGYLNLTSLPREVLDLAEPNVFFMWFSFLIYLIISVVVLSSFLAYKFFKSKTEINSKTD